MNNESRNNCIKLVQLSKSGLEMFFGKLDIVILRSVWAGARTMQDIDRSARKNYETSNGDVPAYTTVASTVQNLVRDGILIRDMKVRSRPTYTCIFRNEDNCMEICVRQTLLPLISNFYTHVTNLLATDECLSVLQSVLALRSFNQEQE